MRYAWHLALMIVVALFMVWVLKTTPLGAQLFVWNGTIVGEKP